jgi:hypothetical protein
MREQKPGLDFEIIFIIFVLLILSLVVLVHPTAADALGKVLAAVTTFLAALGAFFLTLRKKN